MCRLFHLEQQDLISSEVIAGEFKLVLKGLETALSIKTFVSNLFGCFFENSNTCMSTFKGNSGLYTLKSIDRSFGGTTSYMKNVVLSLLWL